ncbi:hypothetical protein BDR06DRAFT_983639 [Suillus hirtellus]|nr:hypothetical protein BDR06DRAFT_983639 [Suillus hirtellus]
MLAEDFDCKHLEGFSKITFLDDWIETSVTINIPTKSKEDAPRPYTIPRFHYCPLVEARAFHLLPFKRLWKDPLDGHQEQMYNELYTSDAWLEAQDDLQKLPKDPRCSLEHVIAGLMLFSNATHLANFGTAKAWPVYAYFGNLTKYLCSSPTLGSCHLVGFLPSLPDHIKDIICSLPRVSKTGMASLRTHCHRELFHACWEILLDTEFLYAALIATIKDMGSCPCPCCLMPKGLFSYLGLVKDMKSCITNLQVYVMAKVIKACEFIYALGNMVDGAKVKDTLGEGSWVPILNQFVTKLSTLGLDLFRMLVVNLMHECKLGTWKALFTHLIRLLYALPEGI